MLKTFDRHRIAQKLLLVTLWLSLVSLNLKVVVGWQTQGLSLLAVSLNTMIASVSLVLALIARLKAQSCYGREVQGHGMVETILALLLVGVLGFGGVSVSALALHRLMAQPQLAHLPSIGITGLQLQVLLLISLLGFGMGWYQRRWGQRYGMAVLIVSANRTCQDAVLMLGLLVGLLAIRRGYVWLDPALAVLISGWVVWQGWLLLQRQLPSLVQQVAIAPEGIAQLVRQIDGVTYCHQIRSRGLVGRQVLIELRLVIHPEFVGAEGWIMQTVEAVLRECYGPVQVLVQIDSDWQGLQRAMDSVRWFDRSSSRNG
jgi:cation diffusion facilitator family transporter